MSHNLYAPSPQIDSDLLQGEADHLRGQLALERERSNVLQEQLADAEGDLRAATARLNMRSVLGAQMVVLSCCILRTWRMGLRGTHA